MSDGPATLVPVLTDDDRPGDDEFAGLPLPGDEDFESTAAQLPVIKAAWRFLGPFYQSDHLSDAWPHMDPTLQLCWAQWWAEANRSAMEAQLRDPAKLASALAVAGPAHGFWPFFERVVLRDFRAAFPANPNTWGIGTAPRVIGPDIELLYLHPEIPPGGIWPEGAAAEVIPLVMRYDGTEWRVLNLGSERIPEPGMPPLLM